MLRGRVVSGVSTVVVIGLLVLAVVTSSGWNDVKDLFFNWDVFKETFPDVLRGFWLDVRLFVAIEIAVLVFGLLVALARFSRSPLLFPVRLLAAVYTDVFRGLPTLLVVFLIGFALPALGWGFVPDSVIVLRNAGIVGAPGMPEIDFVPIPAVLRDAGVTSTDRTTASYGATIVCSIFIASMTTRTSRALTSSPARTCVLTILPLIGASTTPAPDP